MPNAKYIYSINPFVLPKVFFTDSLPSTGIPFESFHYSARTLEEIQANLDSEYESRGLAKVGWKKYKAGTDSYSIYKPDPKNGGNLSKVPVKYFPAIVNDIQVAIDYLLSDKSIPDNRGSLFARIFGDSTSANPKGFWTSDNRIKDGFIVPATNATGSQTLNPLTNILNGQWPFPVDSSNYSGQGHVENPLCRLGIGIDGQQFIKNAPGSLETSSPSFPESVIGKHRTAQNVAIVDGQLVPKPGATLTGIDGIDLPATPEGRPVSNRVNKDNTSTGFGKDQFDPDAGYTFLGHHPMVIQQLMYQPPIIERFNGPDSIPLNNYTQTLYSNSTVNIPFLFSNPMERFWYFRWGQWLVRGKASSDATGLTLINAPDRFVGKIITECPFAVFYPPTSTRCSCSAGDTSYAVWGCTEDPLEWESHLFFQSGSENTKAKRVGAKTRLRLKYTMTASPGSPSPRYYYAVAVRINLIADNNSQPFIPIFVDRSSVLPDGLNIPGANYEGVKGMPVENHSDGSVSINIMDAVRQSYPQTISNDGCFILALGIFVFQSVSGSKECQTVDGPTGSFTSPECAGSLVCSMGEISSKTEYLLLWEPPFSDAKDARLV